MGTQQQWPTAPASTPTAPNMWPNIVSPLLDVALSWCSLLTPGMREPSLLTLQPSEHSTSLPAYSMSSGRPASHACQRRRSESAVHAPERNSSSSEP